jgi:ABC-type Fe3+/spermidine/putrescine transport system ATPase subunit
MSYVKVEALRKHFAGKPPTVAVDDLDLEIEEGEFLVLLGPSGCGKTTTLRCLAGLETPAGGRISLGKTTVFDSGRRVNLSPDKPTSGWCSSSRAPATGRPCSCAPTCGATAPATEYVAAFIGMSNRLVCDHAEGSWRCCGIPLLGGAFQPASTNRKVAVRLRPDDVRLVARSEEVHADEVGFGAKVVDSEFGGRHMDVVVDAEGTRVHARIPAGTTDSWARKLDAGDGVTVAFRPADAQIYDDGVPPEATDPELAEITDVVAVPAAVTA